MFGWGKKEKKPKPKKYTVVYKQDVGKWTIDLSFMDATGEVTLLTKVLIGSSYESAGCQHNKVLEIAQQENRLFSDDGSIAYHNVKLIKVRIVQKEKQIIDKTTEVKEEYIKHYNGDDIVSITEVKND